MSFKFHTKRIYDAAAADDGYRILVDRLWPRGVTKAAAKIDLWAKEAAPSTELRKWFHEDPTRHDQFAARYLHELEAGKDELKQLLSKINEPTVTLLTASKDPPAGHVPILEKFLRRMS